MSTTTRTLATLAALAVVMPTGSAVAVTATDAKKPIKISASAAPKIIDLPGSGKDVVRLTNAPGVRWSVTGDVDETKYAGPFSSAEKYVDVPVNKGGTEAVVTATVSDDSTTVLASDITSWTLPFAIAEVDIASADAPRALDLPGKDKDAVQLTAVEGVDWAIGDKAIPAFKGTKSFSLAKLAPSGFDGTSISVTPTLRAGYTGSVTATSLTLTTDAVVDLPKTVIDDAISDTLNLPGRTRDTVTLLPVAGVKWSVCGSKPFAVTKPTVKSASCKSADGMVPIKAVADKGYTIAKAADYTKSVGFSDAAPRNIIQMPDQPVEVNDEAGTANDTITITPVKNVVWEVATPAKAKGGNPTWKWTKAPKAKQGAAITVKLKPTKGATDTTLYVRPVPVSDDFVLSGWVPSGDAEADDAQAFTTTTALGKVSIDPSTMAPAFDADNNVALTQVEGVTGWNVVRTIAVGDKTKDVKAVVKVAPYSSVIVGGNGASKVTVTPVIDKSYEYKGTPASWSAPTA